jgi:hypothetical protein
MARTTNLAGVEADADLDHGPVRPSDLIRVLLHALLHPECRVAGPHRVILVRKRGAEESHDPSPITLFTVPS